MTRVSVSRAYSSSLDRSAEERASRDTSNPKIAPTSPRQTRATSPLKPSRPSVDRPETPRSASMTSMEEAGQPSRATSSASAYCRAVDSVCTTCGRVVCRGPATGRRPAAPRPVPPSDTSGSSGCAAAATKSSLRRPVGKGGQHRLLQGHHMPGVADDRAGPVGFAVVSGPVSYTHLLAHETPEHLVCRLLLEKKKQYTPPPTSTTVAMQNKKTEHDNTPSK